jgi:hypothetical protein
MNGYRDGREPSANQRPACREAYAISVRFLSQDFDHLLDNNVQPIRDAVSALSQLSSDVEDLVDADLGLFIHQKSCFAGSNSVVAVRSTHGMFLFVIENQRQLPASCIVFEFRPISVDVVRPHRTVSIPRSIPSPHPEQPLPAPEERNRRDHFPGASLPPLMPAKI